MESLVVRISPDGKEAQGLYSDKFAWPEVGELSVRRASDVAFCNEKQEWVVTIQNEDGSTTELPDTFKSRVDAINHEIKYLQGTL